MMTTGQTIIAWVGAVIVTAVICALFAFLAINARLDGENRRQAGTVCVATVPGVMAKK